MEMKHEKSRHVTLYIFEKLKRYSCSTLQTQVVSRFIEQNRKSM